MMWWFTQRWWTLRNWIRFPRERFRDEVHWRTRPTLGDKIIDCRNEIHTVTRFAWSEDDLILDDGHAASWMNCCGHLPKR